MTGIFPVRIDVEDAHLGPVLKQLNGMKGVAGIHLQLGPSQPALSKPMQHRQQKLLSSDEANSKQIIANTLSNGPMHLKVMKAVFERNNRSLSSVASTITKMLRDKTITRVGPGTYRLTTLGSRRYVQSGDNPATKHRVADNSRGLRQIILKALQEKRMTHQQISDFFDFSGYSRANLYNLIPRLREEGLIHRNGDDYEITENGRRVLSNENQPAQIEHQTGDEG